MDNIGIIIRFSIMIITIIIFTPVFSEDQENEDTQNQNDVATTSAAGEEDDLSRTEDDVCSKSSNNTYYDKFFDVLFKKFNERKKNSSNTQYTDDEHLELERLIESIGVNLYQQGLTTEMRTLINNFYRRADLAYQGKYKSAKVNDKTSKGQDKQYLKKFQTLKDRSMNLIFLEAKSLVLDYELGNFDFCNKVINTPTAIVETVRDKLTQALNITKIAFEKLELVRSNLPSVEEYGQYRSELLVLRARINMYEGDTSYRLLGPSLMTALIDSKERQPPSLAKYGTARQWAYQSTLESSDNISVKTLAIELDNRLEWVQQRRAFGGTRFFEVEPIMGRQESASWTPISQLNSLRQELKQAEQERNLRLIRNQETLNSNLKNIEAEFANCTVQKSETLRDITREMSEIAYKIETQKLESGKTLIERADALVIQLASSDDNKRDLIIRNNELEGLIEEKSKELTELFFQIGQITSIRDDEQNETLISSIKQLSNETDEFISLMERDFRNQDNSKSSNLRTLGIQFKNLKNSLNNLSQSAGTVISGLMERKNGFNKKVSSIEGKIRVAIQDNQIEKSKTIQAELKNKFDNAKEDVIKIQTKIQQLGTVTGREAIELKNKILEESFAALNAAKKTVQGEIDFVKGKIDSAKKIADLYQNGKETVQNAIVAAQAAITSAGSIPTGMIAGTSSGVFNNQSNALIKYQETGIKLVEAAVQTKINFEKAKAIVKDIEQTIFTYEDRLNDLAKEFTKTQIKTRINEIEIEANNSKEKLLTEIAGIQAQAQDVFEENKNQIILISNALEDRIKEVKSVFNAEIESIKSDIGIVDNEIARHQRQAAHLAEKAQVVQAALANLWHENRMIGKAISDEIKTRNQIIVSNDIDKNLLNEKQNQIVSGLEQRMSQLERQARVIEKDGCYGGVDTSVASLVRMTGNVHMDLVARSYNTKLIDANKLLFQFANWLYLITRDESALSWAIVVTSSTELEIAYNYLDRLYVEMKKTIGGATPQYFSVLLDRNHLDLLVENNQDTENGADPEQATLIFKVAPQYMSLNKQTIHSSVISENSETIINHFSIKSDTQSGVYRTQYNPLPQFSRLSEQSTGQPNRLGSIGTQEIVFAPYTENELGVNSLLWDAWVIPKWEDKDSIPIENIPIGLTPIGPTYYTHLGGLDGIPVIRERVANYITTSTSMQSVIRQQEQAYKMLVSGDIEKSLVDGSLSGMNYPSVLGRGIGNTWQLVPPKQWSRSKSNSPGWSQLKGVEIVFGYIQAKERNKLANDSITGDNIIESENRARQVLAITEEEVDRDPSIILNELITQYKNNQARQIRYKQLNKRSNDKYQLSYDFIGSRHDQNLRLDILKQMRDLIPSYRQSSNKLTVAQPIENTKQLTIELLSTAQQKFLKNFYETEENQNIIYNNCERSFFSIWKAMECEILDNNQAVMAKRDHSGVNSKTDCNPPSCDKKILKYNDDIVKILNKSKSSNTIENITNIIIENEMLRIPANKNEPPILVGPIELQRIWFEIEDLYGNVDNELSIDNKDNTKTIRAELFEKAKRLITTVSTLEKMEDAIEPMRVLLQRLEHDYLLSEKQLDFVKKLGADLNQRSTSEILDNETVFKLSKIVISAIELTCEDNRNLSVKSSFDVEYGLYLTALDKLKRAFELDFSVLINSEFSTEKSENPRQFISTLDVNFNNTNEPCRAEPWTSMKIPIIKALNDLRLEDEHVKEKLERSTLLKTLNDL